jgi:ribosome maturation factor RimP
MMISEAQITALVEEKNAGTDRFIVAVRVLSGNKIRVFVDALTGMTVRDCVQISRHIEGSLDREQEDFELEVSTPGLTEPFRHPLQYVKNVGRTIKVDMMDGSVVKGEVLQANANEVVILPEPPKKSKKNEALPGPATIPLETIKEAKTVITFN